MKTYDAKEIAANFLRFFAMDPEAQLNYAKGIPLEIGERDFPLGLKHSPLLELADCARGIDMSLVGTDTKRSATELIEDLEAVLELIACANHANTFYGTADSLRNGAAWRLVRKLSRECLREFNINENAPRIEYSEFMSLIID